MFGWDKITQIKNKAGGLGSIVKDFAKDLITVEEAASQDDFNQAFDKLAKSQTAQNPPLSSSPVKWEMDQKIEMGLLRKLIPLEDIRKEISIMIRKYVERSQQSGSDSVNQVVPTAADVPQESNYLESAAAAFELDEAMKNIDALLTNWHKEEGDLLFEVAHQIQQFFQAIQRTSTFGERLNQLHQKGERMDLIILVEKSLGRAAQEIIQMKEQLKLLQEQAANLTKQVGQLQTENVALQKKTVEQQEKVSGVSSQLKEAQQKVKDHERQSSEWDKIKREYIEEIKTNFQEIESLKGKVKAKEQEVCIRGSQLQSFQSEVQRANDLKAGLEAKDEEIERLEKLLVEWQQENQSLQTGIQSIQVLYEQEQERKEQLARKFESELKRVKAEIEKEELGQLKREREQSERFKLQAAQLQMRLEEEQMKHQKLEATLKDVKLELQAMQNKMRQDQTYANNMIDKRVIGTCLTTYLDCNTELSVKVQLLETISSLLGLSQDEKEKIGFWRNNKGLQPQQQAPQQTQQKDSLKDKFIGFLMNSD